MADVTYSLLADDDLNDIYRYTFQTYGVGQAERYDADLKSSGETAALFPSGRSSLSNVKRVDFPTHQLGASCDFLSRRR